jgi:hypothetical protein
MTLSTTFSHFVEKLNDAVYNHVAHNGISGLTTNCLRFS